MRGSWRPAAHMKGLPFVSWTSRPGIDRWPAPDPLHHVALGSAQDGTSVAQAETSPLQDPHRKRAAVKLTIPSVLLVALATSPFAQAGTITGKVVDSLGNGVAGVNITAVGTNTPTITNGGTNAGGFFTTTITPDGVWELHFEPPPPPASTHLVKVIPNVNVSGTVNLGNVALSPGVALTGRTVRAVGLTPVPGVNLDVLVNNVELPLIGDTTNALGQFSIAVPKGVLEVRFKTEGTASPLLAPHKMEVALSAAKNVGDVLLKPGFILSAIVRRTSNNNPVVNADIDVFDSATDFKLFTPGDNTDGAGFVDVVVPSGTYDVEFCPQFSDKLVATTLLSQSVTSNKFLGTVLLANGVVLSGQVKDSKGVAHALVDVDMKFTATQAKVTLCNDNTDANGNYAVIVPTGTFDVKFTPPVSLPLGSQTISSVIISGDKTLNGTLPACVLVYCTSKASSVPNCTPHIVPPCNASLSAGSGSADIRCMPVPGGNAPAILVYTTNGAASTPIQNGFGFLCVKTGPGFFRVPNAALPGGAATTCTGAYLFDFGAYLAGPNPDVNLVPGASVDVQAWYRDTPNPGGANLSDAARFVLVP